MMLMKKLLLAIVAFACSMVLYGQDLVILHMNDTHSHIDPERSGKYIGMGGVIEQAAYIDSVRNAAGASNVLLLHAGDFSQGTSYFTELNGDIEIDVMNALGYDAVCLGNHEFDNGPVELARRLSSLETPVVCANYDFSDTPLKDYVKPYVIVEKAGMRIGVIGLLTDVSEVVDSEIAAMLEYDNAADVADRYAEILKKQEKCDLVICLTHLGYEGEIYTDRELAQVTSNVDIIVGGHSHTLLENYKAVKDRDGQDVVIVTDWKWGLKVGKLTVSE